ncbi:MAG: carboxypeptidase-like regulatory domain-containing protein [Calditrichia bacterium]
MKIVFAFILSLFLSFNLYSGNAAQKQSDAKASTNDSLCTALLINHLRANFDDIHDVSMRFHHMDHTLNGIIQIQMHWENGIMTAASVAANETGNSEFANALIENIKKWHIKELTGPFDIVLPLRIKIVGSDDSTFSQKGILTGKIFDSDNHPIHNARLTFRSPSNPNDTLRNCYSNREGIFVRTLIPTGSWDVECNATGFQKVILKDISFGKGEHLRQKVRMIQAK